MLPYAPLLVASALNLVVLGATAQECSYPSIENLLPEAAIYRALKREIPRTSILRRLPRPRTGRDSRDLVGARYPESLTVYPPHGQN